VIYMPTAACRVGERVTCQHGCKVIDGGGSIRCMCAPCAAGDCLPSTRPRATR
jgi:hypothetical protein